MAQPAKLNRTMVVRAAIDLLQEGGLDALTLRRLASRLGVTAPSLAHHVGDKAQLTALVASTIFEDALDTIPAGRQGDDWLRAFGLALRDKQRATRDITALVATAPGNEELDRAITGRLQAMMRDAGLQGTRAMSEQASIQALVTGWMTFETSPRRDLFERRLPGDGAFEAALEALISGFASRRKPA